MNWYRRRHVLQRRRERLARRAARGAA
jgi:hypothetical protein